MPCRVPSRTDTHQNRSRGKKSAIRKGSRRLTPPVKIEINDGGKTMSDKLKAILTNLLALLTNRIFYSAILTISGSVGLYWDVDLAVSIGSAVAILIGLILGITATPPKLTSGDKNG